MNATFNWGWASSKGWSYLAIWKSKKKSHLDLASEVFVLQNMHFGRFPMKQISFVWTNTETLEFLVIWELKIELHWDGEVCSKLNRCSKILIKWPAKCDAKYNQLVVLL